MNSFDIGRTNLGIYEINGRKYHNKLSAILEADKIGQHIEWNFNDEVFAKYNWSIEPEKSLEDLYADRARQLRQKYDYIVLYFSGGCDSRTMLESFLKNGLRVDEIFVYTVDSVNKNMVWGDMYYKDGNHLSELDIITKPYLRKLHNLYPEIKITIHDWTKDVLESFKSDEWILNTSARFSPNVLAKQNFHTMTRSFLESYDRGKTVGHIFGVDKPLLHLKDNKYFLAFLDVMIIGITGGTKRDSFQTDELFYWQPDVPELLIKQAHTVMKWFEQNPDKKYIISGSTHKSWKGKEEFDMVLKKLIYPNWDNSIWQCPKGKNTTFIGLDRWFWQEESLPEVKLWKDGLKTIDEIVPSYWFNDGKSVLSDMKGCWSKFYHIGDSISEVE